MTREEKAAYNKAYREANREHLRELNRKHYAENREKILEYLRTLPYDHPRRVRQRELAHIRNKTLEVKERANRRRRKMYHEDPEYRARIQQEHANYKQRVGKEALNECARRNRINRVKLDPGLQAYKDISRSERCNISKEDFINWWNMTPDLCVYCQLVDTSTLSLMWQRLLEYEGNIPFVLKAKTCFKQVSYRLEIDRIDTCGLYQIGNIAKACRFCNFIKNALLTPDEARLVGARYVGELQNYLGITLPSSLQLVQHKIE